MIKIRAFKLFFLVSFVEQIRGLEKEINSTNDRSKSYCSGNGFIFVDNYALNESCLNNGKLLVNKKRYEYVSE